MNYHYLPQQQQQQICLLQPAITTPDSEYLVQYIYQMNKDMKIMQNQLAATYCENQSLRSAISSEYEKTILHELGKEVGEFSDFMFINGSDGSPYVEFQNQNGHSVVKPLSDDRYFTARTEEILSKDGCHRTIHIRFFNRNGEERTFAVAEDDYEKKVYAAYCNAGGIMRYGKKKDVAAYLFANFINWIRQNSSVSFDSDSLWAECAGSWKCTADTAVLLSPLLRSVQGNKPELMLDLIRVYGFLESRLSDEKYRIRKIFNFVDTKGSLAPDLSLDSKEKELIKALERKQPILFIYAREPGSAASFYATQRSKSNFDLVSSSVFNGRKSMPVLVSEDLTTLSPKCLVVEYSASTKPIQSTETLEQFADMIVKNPVAFSKVFSDAFERSLETSDPDSAFRSEIASLNAVSSVIEWFYFSRGDENTAETLKEAFKDAISFYAMQWDNFDASDIGEEIRNTIRSAVSSGELIILDRLCVPEKLEIIPSGFYDQTCLYIPERIFTGILSRKLPYYSWYTIRQYLDKAGVLSSNGDRWTAKVSVKLDTDRWIQKRCLTLKLSFFNPVGKINIINLRRKKYEPH